MNSVPLLNGCITDNTLIIKTIILKASFRVRLGVHLERLYSPNTGVNND